MQGRLDSAINYSILESRYAGRVNIRLIRSSRSYLSSRDYGVQNRYKKRLLESYPDISKNLGVSLKFEVYELSRQKAFSDFLKKKSYKSLSDATLDALCNNYTRYGLLFKLSCLVCLLSALLLVFSRNLVN